MKNLSSNILLFLCITMFFLGCQDEDQILNNDYSTDFSRIDEVDQRQVIRPSAKRAIQACDARNGITIGLDDCLEPEWLDAISEAIGEFESIPNTVIDFGVKTGISESEADIYISCSDRSCFELLGLFQGFNAGTTVTCGSSTGLITVANIAQMRDCCSHPLVALDPCVLKGVIMHELMHALGFQHDGDYAVAGSTLVPGTDSTDVNSIMWVGRKNDRANVCNTGCEFSDGDILALQVMFGPCACIDLVGTCECPDETTGPCECAPTLQASDYPYLVCAPETVFIDLSRFGNWDFNVISSANNNIYQQTNLVVEAFNPGIVKVEITYNYEGCEEDLSEIIRIIVADCGT